MAYDGFISYSHAADGHLAPALQHGLQRLAKRWNARRALRIFRDETGLSTNPHLWSSIQDALDESSWFVLLASPEAARSEWVNKEIAYWRVNKPAGRILPVVTDGTWHWDSATGDFTPESSAVPEALRGVLTDEPRHLDLRWARTETDLDLRNSRFRSAVADLAAPMHGVPKDELEGEDIRQYRRARRLARAGVGALAVLVMISVTLGVLTLASRNHAVSVSTTARAQALAAKSQNELSADPEVSVVLARRAVQLSPIPEAVAALRQAIDASPVRVAFPTVSGKECRSGNAPAIAYRPPTGRQVAETTCRGDVIVHDAGTGRVLERRHLAREASAVAYDPAGRVLAVGTTDGVQLLDPDTSRQRVRLAGHGQANGLAFSPDGTQIAATTDLGVTAWDLGSGTVRISLAEPKRDATLVYTPDGRFLIVGTTDATEVLNAATGETVHRLSPPGQNVTTGSDNPVALAGNVLVVASNVDGPGKTSAFIDLWNTTTWTLDGVLTEVTGTEVTSVAVSADGSRVAIGNADGTGGVWSRATKEQLVVLSGQTAVLSAIAFSPNGTTAAAASNDGTARIYRATDTSRMTVAASVCTCGNEIGWRGHTISALVRAGDNVFLQAWRVPSGRARRHPLVFGTNQVGLGVVLSPDGARMARWNDTTPTTTVEVVDTRSRRVVFTLPATAVQGVSFSPDDARLVVADRSGGLHVSTLATGHTIVGDGWTVECSPAASLPPAVSPDGRRVAVWSFCGELTVGTLVTARPVDHYTQDGQLAGITFDPSATRLAVASWAGTVTVLDAATTRPVLELVGHTRGVNGVAYSPDRRYVATTSSDDTVRIWDARTGQALQLLHDPNFPGKPVFSPDGRFVAETDSADQLRVWDACAHCDDPAALLAESRASVVSPLTALEQARIASLSR